MKLSKNFTLEEAIFSQTASRKRWSNIPNENVIRNMKFAASQMEIIRAIFNQPIIVTSWYRSNALNSAIGSNGDHPTGFCIDFKIHGLTIKEIVDAINHSGVKYDQLINEFGRWVHISFHPKMRQQSFSIK